MPKVQSSDFLERIIPEVRTGGARNIVELAKALRIPVETTRYKVKGMIKRGLSVHANVDYNKFGLINHEVYLVLKPKALTNERKFFQSLSESAYLTSFARELPDNSYACSFAAPSSANLSRLLRGLTEEDLIESSRIEPLSWKKGHMIQPSFFQLKPGTWQIDWGKIKKETRAPNSDERRSGGTPQTVAFDELDLMIARTLEEDALIKLSEIAKSLRTTLNNIFYHFHKHILDGKLIDEFLIRWNGTPQQESVFVQFEFGRLTISQEKNARLCLRRLPFLWSDALSLDTGFYIGEAMIPTTQILQTLQFLSGTLDGVSNKLKIRFFAPESRMQFPLPAHLYKESKWKFDPDACVNIVTSKLRK